MTCNVAILAGGQGSRLKSRTGSLPKPMALIDGKPVLEHQILLCREHGYKKIALLVNYQFEEIKKYFADGSAFGVQLTYVVDISARGTAGALLDALDVLAARFLVLYGDTYADINLKEFWKYDSQHISAGTLLLHPNDHPQDSDLMCVNRDGSIAGVNPYPRQDDGICHPNLVNAALYILEKESLLDVIPKDRKTDLAKDTFPSLISAGKILYAYLSPEYIKDMGTPDRLDKVERDLNAGLPEMLSGRNPRAAVFLDRDGTLNEEVDHLKFPEQLKLLDGVPHAIRRLNQSGILAVCITNQPVIARGEVTFDMMENIHARLDSLIGKGGGYLDRLYFCPHHPESGFPGEILDLKIKCTCRKPETGLIDRAVSELNISRRNSWLIGDSTADILAGNKAGLRTILVRTGYAGSDHKYQVDANFISMDIVGAIEWILGGHANAVKKLMPIVLSAGKVRTILLGGASQSGKSTAASVLVELFGMIGRVAHILSLDGWLRPLDERHEAGGVFARYNMDAIILEAERVSSETKRFNMAQPQYDRKIKKNHFYKNHSIGPDDIVIFEGVPALLDERLINIADLSIYMDIGDDVRINRVKDEYLLRGEKEDSINVKIYSRERDEVSYVKNAACKAQFQINLQD